jgi:hypothetical protein
MATGNLDCAIDDPNIDFAFESLFSYSGNGPLFQSKLNFESRHPETSSALRTLGIEKLRLIQQWVEGRDLRLQFYAETEGAALPFAAVKLTIETTAGEDEISYGGRYRLEITPEVVPGKDSEIVRLEGDAACSAG